MQKSLVFYSLILEKDVQLSLLDDTDITLKDRASELWSDKNESEMTFIDQENSFIIDINDITDNYIFGSYGKLENISNQSLIRGRDKLDFKLASLEELIESFTYFLLDLNNNNIIVLYNYKCKGFKKAFAEFLRYHFRISNIYKKIEVTSQISDNIPEIINRSTNFSSVSYSYTSDNLPENNFLGFQEISGITNEQIRSANVRLYLEPEANFESLSSRLAGLARSPDSFNSFTISTNQELIDVIEKTLSKKVDVEINSEDFDDVENIKELLIEHLFVN